VGGGIDGNEVAPLPPTSKGMVRADTSLGFERAAVSSAGASSPEAVVSTGSKPEWVYVTQDARERVTQPTARKAMRLECGSTRGRRSAQGAPCDS
jgi:hypothetical protein